MKLRKIVGGVLAVALLSSTLAGQAMAAPYVADSLLPNQGSGAYDVQHYDIALTCEYSGSPSCLKITATTKITAIASEQLNTFELDFICRNPSTTNGLLVTAVKVKGSPANFQCVNDNANDRHKIVITPATPVSDTFDVAISYTGTPEKYRFVAGFTMDEGWMPVLDYYGSADGGAVGIGQPNGNFTWFPNNTTALDRSAFTTRLTVPVQFKGVGIGVLTSKTTVGTNTTWVWEQPDQVPSFLAVAAIGVFNEHVDATKVTWTDLNGTNRSKTIGIRAYGDPIDEPNLTGGAAGRIGAIKEILQWGTERFGEYQPDSAGYIQKYVGAGWALEIYGRPFFSSPGHMYDSVLVHEYAHQWAGDSVSVKDWKDLWLAEGFATYAEWLWTEDQGGKTATQTAQQLWSSSAANSSYWSAPVANPRRSDIWGTTSYQTGGMAWAALRSGIGDSDFNALIKRWFETYQLANAATADFIALAEQVSKRDLSSWASTWLYTTGKPANWPNLSTYPVVTPMPTPTPTPMSTPTPTPKPTPTPTSTPTPTPTPTTPALKPAANFTPKLLGTAKVKKVLKVTGIPKGWSASYQWLRAGAPIVGATASSYRLVTADAGAKISAQVTITRTSFHKGIRTSATKTVAKVTPKVTIKLSKKTVKRNADSYVTVTITASGITPTGKITVKAGKNSRTFDLADANKGKLKVQLFNAYKGKFKIKATFSGNAQLMKKASKTLTLKVT